MDGWTQRKGKVPPPMTGGGTLEAVSSSATHLLRLRGPCLFPEAYFAQTEQPGGDETKPWPVLGSIGDGSAYGAREQDSVANVEEDAK